LDSITAREVVMRPTLCCQAVSIGVITQGRTALLSVLTSEASSDHDLSIIVSRDLLETLARALDTCTEQPQSAKGSARRSVALRRAS
jgi:hypothetical protein